MLHRIFFFLLALLLLADVPIYVRFLRRTARCRAAKCCFWLPSALLAVLLACLTYGGGSGPEKSRLIGIYLIAYMTLTVPKVLFCLFLPLGKAARLVSRRAERAVLCVGAAVALLSAALVVYGATEGWRHYQVEEVTFASETLPPAFDGYRIVQFSDLHVGTLAGHPDELRRIVTLVNGQHADLIVFTGDLVNQRADELDGMEHILSALRAPDGVYSVLGNHDYGLYARWETPEAQQANLDALQRKEVGMGWQLLNNRHVTVEREGSRIALAGVENDGEPPFPQKGDLSAALRGTEGLFTVLLSHDPTHWRREVLPKSDVQLMLAGHTHAMQFSLFGYTPASWFYPEYQGLYTEGGRGLYVNVGLGSVMLPFRWGAWPEITVITLRRK